jgi:hypothetical protein
MYISHATTDHWNALQGVKKLWDRKGWTPYCPIQIPITVCMLPTFLPNNSVIWLQFSLKPLYSTPLLFSPSPSFNLSLLFLVSLFYFLYTFLCYPPSSFLSNFSLWHLPTQNFVHSQPKPHTFHCYIHIILLHKAYCEVRGSRFLQSHWYLSTKTYNVTSRNPRHVIYS